MNCWGRGGGAVIGSEISIGWLYPYKRPTASWHSMIFFAMAGLMYVQYGWTVFLFIFEILLKFCSKGAGLGWRGGASYLRPFLC